MIGHADKITQLMTFVSSERFSIIRLEGTAYLLESDDSHEIFLPSIITPKSNIISMT